MEVAKKYIILLMLQASLASNPDTDETIDGLLKGPTVTVVTGSRILLPCSMKPDDRTDRPILILFYKGAIGTPVYSLDARNGPSILRSEWIDEKTFGNRATFRLDGYPQGLWINPATKSDDAVYRCRVDFEKSPTRNILIELRVIVPPKSVTISDENGNGLSKVTELYQFGSEVTLICTVDGGVPRPDVSWWRNGQLIAGTSEKVKSLTTINTLSIPNVQRQDFMAEFKCKATNNENHIEDAVRLNITLPPLEVAIRGQRHRIREGNSLVFYCECFGAYPYSHITWWKEEVAIQGSTIKVDRMINVTQSSVSIIASKQDDGSRITCRAENPFMKSGVIESSTKLTVLYPPTVYLQPGPNINLNKLEEGDDIYIECDVQANPKVNGVRWFLNDVEIFHNVSKGIIQSNQSLALQRVHRNMTGDYVCLAVNSEGHKNSNKLFVSIKFKPFCLPGQQLVYGAEKHEAVNATCGVEANPHPSKFVWAFNTSSEIVELEDSSGKNRQHITYRAETDLQFGTLLCWGINDVGKQKVPCVFHIIHSVIPEPVANCSVSNISHSSAFIVCLRGWDGGIKQAFDLKVIDGKQKSAQGQDQSPRVLAKTTVNTRPQFMLEDLVENTQYTVLVYSTNKKGKSKSRRVSFQTTSNVMSSIEESEVEIEMMSHFSYLVTTIISCVVITTIVILGFIYRRKSHSSGTGCFQTSTRSMSTESSKLPFSKDMANENASETTMTKVSEDNDFMSIAATDNACEQTEKRRYWPNDYQLSAPVERFDHEAICQEKEAFIHSTSKGAFVGYKYQAYNNIQYDIQSTTLKAEASRSPNINQTIIVNRGPMEELRKNNNISGDPTSPSRRSPSTVKTNSSIIYDRESAV